jgi:hypothetical protein
MGKSGCAPPQQLRKATCDLSSDASHQALARASHVTAAAMRARITGAPSRIRRTLHSYLNSPNSGIGLFYAESGFFDGKNLDFWRIGSKPFLWRILKTGEKAICRHVTEPLCISQREKVKREILSFWWSSFCLNLQIQELRNAVIGDTNTREDGGRGRRAARPRGAARRRGRRCRR